MVQQTVNQDGLAQIRAHLAAHHKKGTNFTDEMIGAWASDVEQSLSDSGLAEFEIKATDSVSGRTELCTITEDGIDSFHIVEVDGGRDIKFQGYLIGNIESQHANREAENYSGSAGRWTELTLYKTDGGSYVCEKGEYTTWQGERDRHSGAACKTEAEVIEFFGVGWLAKKLYKISAIDASIRIE